MLTSFELDSETSFSEMLSADWRINLVLVFEADFKSGLDDVFTLLLLLFSCSLGSNNDLLARLFELDEWIILLECWVDEIKNSELSSIAPPNNGMKNKLLL